MTLNKMYVAISHSFPSVCDPTRASNTWLFSSLSANPWRAALPNVNVHAGHWRAAKMANRKRLLRHARLTYHADAHIGVNPRHCRSPVAADVCQCVFIGQRGQPGR
jgi:hypothetical protein